MIVVFFPPSLNPSCLHFHHEHCAVSIGDLWTFGIPPHFFILCNRIKNCQRHLWHHVFWVGEERNGSLHFCIIVFQLQSSLLWFERAGVCFCFCLNARTNRGTRELMLVGLHFWRRERVVLVFRGSSFTFCCKKNKNQHTGFIDGIFPVKHQSAPGNMRWFGAKYWRGTFPILAICDC